MGYSVRTDRVSSGSCLLSCPDPHICRVHDSLAVRALVLNQYRYTEWFQYVDGKTPAPVDFNQTVAVELYDHLGDDGGDMDFYDQANVASDPANAQVVAELAAMVRGGWRPLRPPSVAVITE